SDAYCLPYFCMNKCFKMLGRFHALGLFFLLIFLAYYNDGFHYVLPPLFVIFYSATLAFSLLYGARLLGRWAWLLTWPLGLMIALAVGYRFQFGERVSVAVLQSIVDSNAGE